MPADQKERSRRLAALRRLLRGGRLHSQAQLVTGLKSRGFSVTQSSVSRDLKDLQASKRSGSYVLPPVAAPVGATQRSLPSPMALVLDLLAAGDCLLVVKTATGGAARVGLAIDLMGLPEVVGTIAGDDTVFVATRNKRDRDRAMRRLASARARAAGARG